MTEWKKTELDAFPESLDDKPWDDPRKAAEVQAAQAAVITAAEAWMLARMELIEAREQGGPEDIDRAEMNLAHREMRLHEAVRALRALQQPAAPGAIATPEERT